MMPTLRLLSVRHKLLLMVLVANVCTLLAAGAALLYHDLSENRARTAADLSTLAAILSQGSAAALEFDDPKVANENLVQLQANPNIVAAAIYTAEGSLFTRYVREREPSGALPGAPEADGVRFEGGELILFKQIAGKRGALGTIYLKQRYQLSSWLGDYLAILGAVLLASLALGMFISTRLQRWISGPIQAVSGVARQVMQQRDYHLRATKSSEDEIGQLADAFNGMLQTLEHEIGERSAAEQAVRTLNAELERRVASRTTELEAANQQLQIRTDEAESANRAKADFLSNMSHEIRTPMNGILGLAYLLDQKQLDADASDLVKKIRNAGRSLQAIINDILDFSKIEAGRLEIENAPFRIIDVFDNLAGIMAANAGDKNIELIIAPPPDVGCQLLGDALRLEQVLINLTGNAIKFTEQGEVSVDIRLLAKDDNTATLRFSVRDSGIGIPLEKQRHIFASFSQADVSTTRRFGGTGLGLTICRYLVSKMGGEIDVISEPGRGSEFWFTIPFEWTAAGDYAAPEMAALEVLIADDNDVARDNLALMAGSIGWATSKAGSGEEAIRSVRAKLDDHGAFDVLLIDWKMTGMDGLAAAAAIRDLCQPEVSPIVLMVTAFSRDDLLKQNHIGAVDGILTKPVTSSALYNSVAEVLRRRGHAGFRDLPHPERRCGKRVPGVRALVVDDSEINREVARRILEGEGAVVSLANDGQAALDWLRKHPDAVDVVLMDVQMPVMDGYEATRQLRGLPHGADLPVIALTAGAFKTQQDAARRAGMDAFVSKPFNVDELIAAIVRLTRVQAECVEAGHAEARPPVRGQSARADDFPGIAVEQGMRAWRDPAAYRKFLRKFAADYAACADRLDASWAANNLATARALLHKLKGAAGSLALADVARCAAEVESTGLAGDSGATLRDLRAALDIACASIASFAEEEGRPAAPAAAAGRVVPAAPWLAELLSALNTDNPDRANRLFDGPAPTLPPAALAGIRARVDDFDFRAAEALVLRLADEMEPEVKE